MSRSISTPQAIELTQALVRFDTVNPPGNEHACAKFIASLLRQHGFDVTEHRLGRGRTNLVASLGIKKNSRPLCFSGHLDTVPLGSSQWSINPFGGDIVDGKLYGRGSTDMKGGIASFLTASFAHAEQIADGPGVVIILTASEETGCQGAAALVRDGVNLFNPGALLVGEMTSNVPLIGHKGALWLRLIAEGKAAHGAMPERGVNALYKAGTAVRRLEQYRFKDDDHDILGAATLSVGTMHGGNSINIVPDRAEIGVDIRTLPHMVHSEVHSAIRSELGVSIAYSEPIIDLPGVFTPETHTWVQSVFRTVAKETGVFPVPMGARYFTDASVLQHAFPGVPTIILGPGEPALAHQIDEYCKVENILQSARIYGDLISDWCLNQ